MSMLAIVMYELASEPHTFRETMEGIITNGYYNVVLNGSAYGMGVATYRPEGADKTNMEAAIKEWKRKTRWKQAQDSEEVIVPPVRNEPLYMKFATRVKTAHTSFLLHHDKESFALNIGKLVSDLDAEIAVLLAQQKREPRPKTV